MTSSPWKVCNYTRREIDRAGAVLRGRGSDVNPLQYLNAYSVMDSWRSSHSFPLNTMQMTLRRRAAEIDEGPEVVQRLKRAPSVISKLRRFSDMQLSRMQDLGGCRAIVAGIPEVLALRKEYDLSRDRHELTTEKDYIESPQDSGYRGIHLIYKYSSDRSRDFNGHRIEIQIRTRIQHAWATAVEIAGIYVRTPLKSSIGPQDWLEFFKFASSAFSVMENANRLHSNLAESEVVDRLRRFDQQIDARSKLKNFADAHEFISQFKRRSDSHFILILDLSAQTTKIEAFGSITRAAARYAELEREFIESDLVDVVLVAAESIESVARAYPNYFVDTSQFLKLLDSVLG